MQKQDSPSLQSFAEAYTAAWCSHDPVRVAAFFAELGSLSVNDSPPAVGRQAISEVARGFMSDFPDLLVEMNDFSFEDHRPIYHWTLTSTNIGPGGTGRKVRISGFEIWEMSAAGLIAKSQGHFDAADYERQLRS